MRKLKLFFACLLMAVLSIGQMWADEVTFNYADYKGKGTTSSGSEYTMADKADVSIGDTKFWGNNSQAHFYANGVTTITPAANVTITQIVLTATESKYNGYQSGGTMTWSTGMSSANGKVVTWTGSAASAFTLTHNKQIRWTSIVVTYSKGSTPPPSKTLESVTVSGTPTKTSYTAGENFDPAGLTVTGHYSESPDEEITSGITWAYNPSQTLALNQTSIGVTATVGEVSSAEYNVTGLTVIEAPTTVTFAYEDYKTKGGPSGTGSDYTMVKSQVSIGDTKFYGNNSYAHFYASGVTTITPAAGVTIKQIVLTASAENYNGYQSNGTVTASVGSVSHEGVVVTWTGSTDEAFTISHDKQIRWMTIVVTYEQGEAPAVAKPTISGETPFLGSTTVTISHDDADHIYYTTNGDAPTTSSVEYTGPFSLTETATVKAIAVKGSAESAAAEKAFTKATVLTVAEALAAPPAANQYVKGIIASITEVQLEQYFNATYTIKDEGAENSMIVYRGKYLNNADFTSLDQIMEGDEVTVYGNLVEYKGTNQLGQNNYIIVQKKIARIAWSAASYEADIDNLSGNVYPTLINNDNLAVSYSSTDISVAEIDANGVITLNATGTTTIKATYTATDAFRGNEVSYELNVVSNAIKVTISFDVDGGDAIEALTEQNALPNPLPVATKAGKNFGGWFTDAEKTVPAVAGAAITENTTLHAKWLEPYSVAEAMAVIDAAPAGTANQYVAGIISQIDSYNNTYKSITYWISADGTTTNQLQVYGGLIGNAATALKKEQFSAKEDLELGDEVVVTGTLKLHNSSVYEFDYNNYIYTFSRKASAGLEYAVAAVEKIVGDDAFINPLTNPNSVAVSYGTSNDQVAEVANDGTVTIVGEGTATITASFAGNATYKAAVVSYTLTVSATVDTRHIANSPATFTTTNGNLDPADIAYASYQGGSNTAPAIYNDGIRLYQISGSNDFGGFVTITAKAGCTIDEVQITTTSKYATTVAYSKDGNETLLGSESVAKSGAYTTGTGLNVSSVNIINLGTGSSGRLEIASIKVYYTGEPATIDHYELGGTYQTAFMQGDEFNHTGLIVYAAYDALGENKVDITASCTFSDPDMSTTGEKTIEITYNEAVVKSYTINVNADSRKVANSPAAFTTVSGDMTPADITFASYQGDAGTAPANYNDGIRLYQAPSTDKIGGFITLKAKKGCTIDQVKITTTNTYATTVAYSVDGNENLLGSESVAKSSDYSTPSGLNVESVNIVNKGTGSSGRLEIASIKVWYTGDPLAVDHYILGGTYATEFEQYGEFNYEGLTVTAAYDAGETITEAVTGFTVEANLNTAGTVKANVMLNSVKIAEYDITVTASAKTDPALEYSPASVILTLGDALSAPTLSNIHNVSPISYESSKPAVATVDAEGNISLAGGTGVAVITASFAENDEYIASEATFTITVNEPAEDLSGTWVLATSVAVGDKIIIGATYQDATKSMGAQNGNNRLAVASTLDAGVLSPGEGTKVFTLVDAGDGKFAIQALNGNYLSAAGTGTSNYLKEAADYTADNAKWSISIDGEGVASVVALSENRNAMQYNSGSTLFSCYASVTSQRPINIYKKGTPTPVYTEVRSGLTAGNYYTICYPKAMTDVQGATLWSFVGKDADFAYIVQETATTIEAGKPYIMYATASTVTAVLGTDVASAGVNGAIHGTLDPMVQSDLDDAATDAGYDVYLVIGNELRRATGEGTGSNTLPANRAFVVLGAIPNAPAHMPAHVRRMPMQKDVATGFENLNASEKPVKLLIDGNIYILRGEKMYDATGRLVK